MNPRSVDKNNIPKKEGCILAGTHVSNYDFMAVGCFTLRPIHFLAKKEIMDIPVLGKMLKFAGIIRVDRSKHNPEAKAMAVEALENDKIICVFPEGTINRKMETPILPFKYGAVSFAQKSGKPIVPFAIINKPKFFNYKTKVIFGKPYYVKSDDLEKEKALLEKKVIELIKKGSKNDKKSKKRRSL